MQLLPSKIEKYLKKRKKTYACKCHVLFQSNTVSSNTTSELAPKKGVHVNPKFLVQKYYVFMIFANKRIIPLSTIFPTVERLIQE